MTPYTQVFPSEELKALISWFLSSLGILRLIEYPCYDQLSSNAASLAGLLEAAQG